MTFEGAPLPEEVQEAHSRSASDIFDLRSLDSNSQERILLQQSGQVVGAAQLHAVAPRDDGKVPATVGTLLRERSVRGGVEMIDPREWHAPSTIAAAIATWWARRASG
jgi:hypothetical protein